MASCFLILQKKEKAKRLTVCPFWFPALKYNTKKSLRPKLRSGTGSAMANVTVQIIREWMVEKYVEALSFDTTASNTGIHSVCCQLIEAELARLLLFLACRQYIVEFIQAAVFKSLMAASSGTDIQLFKRFREQWSHIAKDSFSSFMNPRVDDYGEWRDATIDAMKTSLEKKSARDD